MHTETCPDCQKEFTKSTEGRAIMALTMHRGRSHTHTIKTPMSGNPTAIKKARETRLAQLRAAREARNGEPVVKRKYTKRPKETVSATFTINFCPQCGFDMKRTAVAMALAERMKA